MLRNKDEKLGGQKEWLSELRKYSDSIRMSILDLGVLVK
jgi:hypothetical protein